MSKIFLTGAMGFVGSVLSRYLSSQGNEVIALEHDLQLGRPLPDQAAILAQGDIRDFPRLREILSHYRPDAIIHLAAKAIVAEAQRDPYPTFDVNVNGTIALLEAWHEASPDAYFLYFSTDKVYGNGLEKTETDPVKASGIYESSKAAADLITQAYGSLHPVAITRTCNIYGPGDRNSRIIPNTIRQCLRGETPVIYQKAGKREYIFIDDVCRIITSLVEKRQHGIWNIASGLVLSNEQVVKEICKHFPTIQPRYAKSPPWLELDDQCLNTEKLCSSLDCLSFETFPSGIARTVEWWRTQ
jgi:dTDP-glucose 4,6-dehydratase